MATRGTLYRCHLFSFAGPQTEGVASDWTVNLVPVGDGEVFAGELLELYATVDGTQQSIRPDAPIRFDILEEDYALSGGADDAVVTLLGTGARPYDDDFRVVQRRTEHHILEPGASVVDFVRRYRERAQNLEEVVLLIEHETDEAAAPTYHILAWWTVEHAGDWLNAELYFLLNVDDRFDDRSAGTLDVAKDSPRVRVEPRAWQAQTALRRLHSLLTTNLFDWSVSESEALEAIRLLRLLPAREAVTTLLTMRLLDDGGTSKWTRLVNALQESTAPRSADATHWLLLEMSPDRGPIVPGDRLKIEVFAGSRPEPEVSEERVAERFDIPMIGDVDVLYLSPVEAANRIAWAYMDGYFFRPSVVLTFLERGSGYGLHPLPLSVGPVAAEHRSTVGPDPDDPATRRRVRLERFTSYLRGSSPDDPFTVTARLHYYHWLEENRDNPEFLTTTPVELWGWALGKAGERPPQPPIMPYLALVRSMMERRDAAPPDESRRLNQAISRYLGWVDANSERLDDESDPPEGVWEESYSAVVIEEIEEDSRRALEESRRPAPVDLEAVGTKLDEALAFVTANVWRPSEPDSVRWEEESGGFLGLFEERHAYSSLILPSEAEGLVRTLIGRAYLDDLMDRLKQGRDLTVDISADFTLWIAERPELHRELLIAHAHPRVETREVAIDVPAWQQAVEIGIGFVPIVGQVLAAVELTTGRSMFGRTLSTAEQAIVGASILLPAAGKIYGTSTRALRTVRLIDDYGDVMTRGEIDALYRAVLPLRPGSSKTQLLQRAADDLAAGRPITDPDTLRDLRGLLDEMGFTDPVTRRRLGLPAGEAFSGTRLATELDTTRFIFEALGGKTQVYRRQLSKEAQDSVRAAARVDPVSLRRVLQSETEQSFNRYREAILDRMGIHGAPPSQVALLGESIDKLHLVQRARLANLVPPHASVRINALGTRNIATLEGADITTTLARRERGWRTAADGATGDVRRRALNNASRYKRTRERIEEWLSHSGDDSLAGLVRTVGESSYLSRLVTNGGDTMIRRAWIQYHTRSISVSFPEYVRILGRHYRGNFGEFEVAFRLGDTHIFLKAPDELVTVRGTDLIAIPRSGEGPLLLIDNKAFSKAEIDAVGALTRNLPRNIATDVAELGRLAGAMDLPDVLLEGLGRLQRAGPDIERLLGTSLLPAATDTATQSALTRILSSHGIERVVSNAGGQVSGLSADLRTMGIDLLDLN